MRIKKSPYSQSKSQNKFKISPFKSKKDFQIRTYRNGQKDQHKWDKTRRKKKRKENTHTCSMNNSDSLSLLKGLSTVTHIIAFYLPQLPLTSSAPYSGYRPV